MKRIDRLKKTAKRHAHHVIFGMSLLSLTLLVSWWAVFINRSVNHQRSLDQQNLELTLASLSVQLGTTGNNPPLPGVIRNDRRFEIVPRGAASTRFARQLLPNWPNLCLQVREVELKAMDKDFKQKKIMVAGESSFLVLLILLSSILFYQFIKLEKRSTHELEELWERVTHEIKTPITGIKAFLQSLKNRSLDPTRLPQFLDMALKQVERQEQLAENILAGCSLRSPKNTPLPLSEDLNLNRWIKLYFDRHMIHLTDARFSLHFDAAPLIARVDPHILRLILDNIVDNALKYCSPGLELTVRGYTRDKKAVIAIQDNGPGFNPEFSEKIFEAYRYPGIELPGTLRIHGSGIGLYISRQLAEKMAGRLEASSKGKGQGAEFRLYLNLSKEQQQPNERIPDQNP